MARPKIIDRDRGYRRLVREMGKATDLAVTVGLHEEQGGEPHGAAGLSLAQIAAVHEFGSAAAGIPRRSFIADGVSAEEREIGRLMQRLGRAIIRRRVSAHRAHELLGEHVLNALRERIREHIAPALAPSTVARKGSSTPLIDTGQLIQSLRSVVQQLEAGDR